MIATLGDTDRATQWHKTKITALSTLRALARFWHWGRLWIFLDIVAEQAGLFSLEGFLWFPMPEGDVSYSIHTNINEDIVLS